MKTIYNIYIIVFLLSLLVGCTDDSFPPGNGLGEDPYTSVTLSLELPGSTASSARPDAETRASSDPNALIGELQIATLDVFAFDPTSQICLFRVEGSDITTDSSDDSKKTFTVTLRRGVYDLVILANSRAEVETFYPDVKEADGYTLTTVQETIVANTTGKLNFEYGATGYRPIPMWGIKKNVTIDQNTNLQGTNAFQMTRMVARIDVSLSDVAKTNFRMTSIHLYNYNQSGSVLPADGAAWGLDGYVTVPSLPNGSAVTTGPLTYTSTDGEITNMDYSIGKIYSFEARAGSRSGYLTNTCLVIGGTYKGQENHFYRMDFATVDNNSTTWLPLLRNHLYKVTVTKVDGPGYRTKEDAFKSLPENIEVEIMKWNVNNLSNVNFDNNYFLGLSSLELGFSGIGGTNKLGIETNCAGWSYLLTDNPNPEATSPGIPSWLSVNTSHTAGTTYTTSVDEIGLSANPIPDTHTRTAYLHVFAGRFIMTVTITQEPWYISRAVVTPDNIVASGGGETYTVTVDGYFDEIPIRLRTSQGELIEEKVIGVSGTGITNGSGQLQLPSYWYTEAASKQLIIEYYNKAEDRWIQLLAPGQQAYWVHITTTDPDINDFTGWGSYMNISITGNFPSLPIRFSNSTGNAAIESSHPSIPAGTPGTYRIYVPYNNEGNPDYRTINFQYWDGTYAQAGEQVWTSVFSLRQRQGNIVLPEYDWRQYNWGYTQTGNSLGISPARNRVLAHQDYDHLMGGGGLMKNWYAAMGINPPAGMNSSLTPYPDGTTSNTGSNGTTPARGLGVVGDKYLVSTYTPEVATGCGAYKERDFGELQWMLPTLLEANQIKYMYSSLQRPAGFNTFDDPVNATKSAIYCSTELSDYYFFDDFGPSGYGNIHSNTSSSIYSGPPFNYTSSGSVIGSDLHKTSSLIILTNNGPIVGFNEDQFYMGYMRKNGSYFSNTENGFVNTRCVRQWNPTTDIGGPGYVPVFNW